MNIKEKAIKYIDLESIKTKDIISLFNYIYYNGLLDSINDYYDEENDCYFSVAEDIFNIIQNFYSEDGTDICINEDLPQDNECLYYNLYQCDSYKKRYRYLLTISNEFEYDRYETHRMSLVFNFSLIHYESDAAATFTQVRKIYIDATTLVMLDLI